MFMQRYIGPRHICLTLAISIFAPILPHYCFTFSAHFHWFFSPTQHLPLSILYTKRPATFLPLSIIYLGHGAILCHSFLDEYSSSTSFCCERYGQAERKKKTKRTSKIFALLLMSPISLGMTVSVLQVFFIFSLSLNKLCAQKDSLS